MKRHETVANLLRCRYYSGMSDPQYIDVATAAKRLKVSPQRIRQWIDGKRIPAVKIGGVWLIRLADCRKPEAKKPGPKTAESA